MANFKYPKIPILESDDCISCNLWLRRIGLLFRSYANQEGFELLIFISHVISALPLSCQLWGDAFLEKFRNQAVTLIESARPVKDRWKDFEDAFQSRFGMSKIRTQTMWTQLKQSADQSGAQFLEKAAFLIGAANMPLANEIDTVVSKMLPSYGRILIAQNFQSWDALVTMVQRIDCLEVQQPPVEHVLFQDKLFAPSTTNTSGIVAGASSSKVPISKTASMMHLKVSQQVKEFLSTPGHLLPYLLELANLESTDWSVLERVGLSRDKFVQSLKQAFHSLDPVTQQLAQKVSEAPTPPKVEKTEEMTAVVEAAQPINPRVESQSSDKFVHHVGLLEKSVNQLTSKISKLTAQLETPQSDSDNESLFTGAALSKLKVVSDDFSIAGKRIRSLLDTGASVNLLSEAAAIKLSLPILPCPPSFELTTASNQPLFPVGKISAPVSLFKKPVGHVEFFVAKTLPFPAILSSQFFDKHNAIIDFKQHHLTLSSQMGDIVVPFCPVQSNNRSPLRRARLGIKLLNQNAKKPIRGSPQAAGFDIFSPCAITLQPNERRVIPLGFALQIPGSCYGRLASRSSLAAKGVDVVAGVIDRDYRGEVSVVLHNFSPQPFEINVHDRIGQLVIEQLRVCSPVLVDYLTPTMRGEGSFGSSGN